MSILRNEVSKFAEAMENELRENDYKGGWKLCDLVFLVRKLDEEVKEVLDVLTNYPSEEEKKQILSECADAANILMMIADVTGSLD